MTHKSDTVGKCGWSFDQDENIISWVSENLSWQWIPVTKDVSLLLEFTQECCYNCINAGWTKSLIHHQIRCVSPRNLMNWEIVDKASTICSPHSGWLDCPGYEELK